MSACTTLRITRLKAIEVMIERLVGDISDEELEDFMDELLEHRLYNCVITYDDVDNDDGMV